MHPSWQLFLQPHIQSGVTGKTKIMHYTATIIRQKEEPKIGSQTIGTLNMFSVVLPQPYFNKQNKFPCVGLQQNLSFKYILCNISKHRMKSKMLAFTVTLVKKYVRKTWLKPLQELFSAHQLNSSIPILEPKSFWKCKIGQYEYTWCHKWVVLFSFSGGMEGGARGCMEYNFLYQILFLCQVSCNMSQFSFSFNTRWKYSRDTFLEAKP